MGNEQWNSREWQGILIEITMVWWLEIKIAMTNKAALNMINIQILQ